MSAHKKSGSGVPPLSPQVGRVAPNAPWPVVRVKDVAISIQYGHTASAVDRQNGPRFLRITDIQDGRVDWSVVPSCDIPDDDVPKYQLKPGDLVFARTGATTGKSYLIRDCPQSVFASYLIRVRVSDEVAPEFLALFFQSPGYWAQIESGKRGIGQPNVNGKVLGEVQMPLPPLPEQRRIVAEIETQWAKLDAGVTALKRVQANLKRYRAAVLKAACEGRLVRPVSNWSQTNVGAEATVLAGCGFPERLQGRASGDIPFFKVGDISEAWKRQERALKKANHYITEAEVSELRARLLPQGAVVFAKIGAAIALNRRAILGQPSLVDNNVMGLVAGSRISTKFLFHFMCTQKLDELARATTVPSLRKGDVESIPISLPPLAEQTRIVAEMERRLSVIDELETLVATNLARGTRLRQSILKKALAGQL